MSVYVSMCLPIGYSVTQLGSELQEDWKERGAEERSGTWRLRGRSVEEDVRKGELEVKRRCTWCRVGID